MFAFLANLFFIIKSWFFKKVGIEEEAIEKEKVFKNFPELPWELSAMIVDEMRADDRCRFSRASKRCNKEVKSSKNHVYSLIFSYQCENWISIFVDYYGDEHDNLYYGLEFEKKDGVKYISQSKNCSQEKWRTELDDSKTLLQHAIDEFKMLLQQSQRTIKKLGLYSNIAGDNIIFDAEINNLRKLEELSIEGNFDTNEFLSKLKRPLKKLEIVNPRDDEINMDEIYQVQDDLNFPSLKLKNEQFSQLSASKINTHIGLITVQEVFEFIRSWQNGAIDRETSSIHWSVVNSSFDVQKLFMLCGDFTYNSEIFIGCYSFNIKHRFDDRKTAELSIYAGSLRVHFTTMILEPE